MKYELKLKLITNNCEISVGTHVQITSEIEREVKQFPEQSQIKISISESVYDFVTKPIESAELLARIDSHLSRSEILQLTKSKFQQVGDLLLDTAAVRISFKAGKMITPINFSPIEFKILEFLINNSDKVRTRDQLALAVWKRKYF